MLIELKLPQKHAYCIKITSELIFTKQNMVLIEIDRWSSDPYTTLNISKN